MFLGREEKAVSALTADSVGSIDISKVTGVDVPSVYGSRIDVSLSAAKDQTTTWEAPSSGLFVIYSLRYGCALNGCRIEHIGYSGDDPSDDDTAYYPIRKGDVVVLNGGSHYANSLNAFIYPLQLIKEVTENE